MMTYHDGSCCRCGATGPTLVRISEFGKAVCEQCFPEHLRRHVETTIRRFRMIPRRSRVAVALSGGSDSGTLIHVLGLTKRRLNYSLVAIHIDMGLGEYSAICRDVAEAQAQDMGVEFHVDEVHRHGVQVRPVRAWPICAVCGAVRRTLLPRLARQVGADVLCTGHTLDDQLQYMLKNILSGKLWSPPPVLAATPGWPAKVKPLIQVPDEAAKTYAKLVGIRTVSEDCPHFDPASHRLKEVFHLLERHAPMGKLQFWRVLRRAMSRPVRDGQEEHPCPECGHPTYMPICPLCRLRREQNQEQPRP